MIYRIHFNAKKAYWCIQFSRVGIFWETVSTDRIGPVNSRKQEQVEFLNYDQAETYVKDMGIDKAYDRRQTRGFSSAIHSGLMNYSIPQGWKLVQMEDRE